jgi:hypothetical protein
MDTPQDDPQAQHDRDHPEPPPTHAVQELPDAECWRLLVHGNVGRLAVQLTDGTPDIFPVNYVASKDHRLYIRSAPGTKLMAIAAHHDVAFEIDGFSDVAAWSVVVHGVADRLDADDEIEASGVLALASWSPTAKHDFVRITPRTTTGRSFRLASHTASIPVTSASGGEPRSDRSRPPQVIPSFAPSRAPSSSKETPST